MNIAKRVESRDALIPHRCAMAAATATWCAGPLRLNHWHPFSILKSAYLMVLSRAECVQSK